MTSSCMLAREVPLLNNIYLCEFLRNMDEEETGVLSRESEALHRVQRDPRANPGPAVGLMAGGALALILWPLAGIGVGAGIIFLGGLGSSTLGVTKFLSIGAPIHICQKDINDQRMLRLLDKVRNIEEALIRPTIGEDAKRQLRQAKDFFSFRHVQMLLERTPIRVEHVRA
jgi:hypothetical protein